MARTPRLEALTPRTRLFLGLGMGCAAVLLLLGLRRVEAVGDLELALVDLRTRHFVGQRPPDPRIVLAEIADDDVVRLQGASPWPWPLTFNAYILRALAAAGARAVAVDIYHLDRGAGPEDYKPTGGAAPTEDLLGPEMADADALSAALAGHGRATVAFQLSEQPDYEIPTRVAVAEDRLGIEGIPPPTGQGIVRPHARLPVVRVTRGARVLSFANTWHDDDGVARRGATVGRWGGRPALSLPLAAALLAVDGPREVGEDRVRLGDARQRLDADGSFLINFRDRTGGAYTRVPPADLVTWGAGLENGEPLPPEAVALLKDKIVVLGVWMAGREDNVASPLGTMHGPRFQAAVLDNLLHGDGRVRAPGWVDPSILLVTCLLLGVLGMMLRPWLATAIAMGTLSGGVAFAFWLFGRGWSIDIFTPLLGAFLTWGGTAMFRLFTEGKRNKWLEGTFTRYVGPEIVEALKRDPSRLTLGGHTMEVTLLFSDIAGFTRFSEKLKEDQLTRLLNRYLTDHSKAVMREGGVVDKFMGDGVMAFFGDPIAVPDHALRACRAALSAIAIPPRLLPLCEEYGIPELVVRVGLNTGLAKVGNMGSDDRLEYTCMGDTVNLASRLEGANKAFGSRIMIGPLTYEQAKAGIVSRPLAELVVVGKAKAVAVHELLALREGADRVVVALADAFALAEARARAGDLAGAHAALDECERLRPGDGPSAWFRGLLRKMEAGEEPVPWSGRVTLESK